MAQIQNGGRVSDLIETAWLSEHMDDPSVRIVDATFTLPDVKPTASQRYAKCHIPGAVFFDIEKVRDPDNPLPHMLPNEQQFAAAMGELGIGNEHHVVVYDGFGLSSAPRVWWMLRIFGHENVSALNGGLPKWQAEGRPVTADIQTPAPARFMARLDRSRVRDRAQMLANVAGRREQVIDARSAERFAGTVEETRPGLRRGHIPWSISLPSDQLIDPVKRTVLPPDLLAKKYRDAGLDPANPTIASCGSGVAACALAFGMHLLGWPEPAIYDGSWSEWGLPGNTPIEVG